ncbi:hypothetical protein AB656_05510 [Bifidobacterium actinocoloniiforme DSM 22766]|nr:hypothetical protein AB656_05510 [Bifidobacterium actinocoloniiforme DSM 22766]
MTLQVAENGTGTGIGDPRNINQLLPAGAKPVGAGYIFSATKLDYSVMQRIVDDQTSNGQGTAANKAVTDKVMEKFSDTVDKTGGKSTIYLGTTDGQGQITVGSSASNGVWLQGATYDRSQNKVNGGSPAAFNLDRYSTYWLVQVVSGPTGKIASGDPVVVQLPDHTGVSSDPYRVTIRPKVQVRDAPPAAANASSSSSAPQVTGRLAATGSNVQALASMTILLLIAAGPLRLYAAQSRR